jgi:hypothetical protein
VKEPPDLHELVGDDLPADELERLRHADALLRSVPAPPHEVPQSLTQAVARVPEAAARRSRPRRRFAVALAFAAVVAALAFGIGRWAGDNGFDTAYRVTMEPTAAAPNASAVIDVGPRDAQSGNFEMQLDVSGLPPLEGDDYYALWLGRDGKWGATCGYFSVGEGETTVRMTASYDVRDFDSWVISAAPRDGKAAPLLVADIPAS